MKQEQASFLTRLMRRLVMSRRYPKHRFAFAFRLWQIYGPLGACNLCRSPTWNPVTFQTQLKIGRAGHYYCEKCGPPMLVAAEAVGEKVVGR